MASKLIGKKVFVKETVDSPYAGKWGIITGLVAGKYIVSPWGGDCGLIFERNEFKVAK